MEILTALRDTPLPTILVVVGSIFLLLAVISKIGTYIALTSKQQKWAASIGGLLLVLGIGLHLVPPAQLSSEALLIATATTTSTPAQVSITTIVPSPTALLPLNARLATAAWDEYNNGNYENAITYTQDCIDMFESQALREQQEFTASGKPTPSVGSVGEVEYQEIISRGVLNDVATCYFIKGESLAKLNRLSEAKEAYMSVLRFSAARTLDPIYCQCLGCYCFWAPAEVAADRLAKLP